MKLKIKSKIDVITNSSSEIYCRIGGPEEELERLHEDLLSIFGWRQEYEMDVVAELVETNEITIDLPYHLEKFKPFYKAGLEELIKNYPGVYVNFCDDEGES